MTGKTVYGYIRVSTAKQGTGVSLEVQQDSIIHYAEKHNLNIVRWFEEKETAAKQGRPLFNEMMKLLRARKATGVVIHKVDRSARNLKDWADLGNLIDQGVEVHFAHESLDLQARGGRLSADIQAIIAADYIRNLRQEAIKGLYGRLKQGIYPFAAPIGYRNHGKGALKTIDPVMGPLVRKAFELYSTKNHTLETLAAHINQLGLRNTWRAPMTINNLWFMLNNPFYAGILKVKGQTFKGKHKTIISPHLFKSVQDVLRGKTNQRTTRHNFLFKKKLRCTHCNFSLVGELQKGQVYYRCHTKGCLTKSIRETTVENLLAKSFALVELHQEECDLLKEILNDTKQGWSAQQDTLLASLKLRSDQLDQKLDRLTDCYVDGELEKEIFERRKGKILFEMKENENSVQNIRRGITPILDRVEKFLELAKSLIKSYRTGILEEKRQLVEIVTSNLSVAGRNLVTTMRSPFFELSNRYSISLCRDAREAYRKKNAQFVFSNINTSPVIGKAMTKEQLEPVLKEIIEVVSQLPEIELPPEHDL